MILLALVFIVFKNSFLCFGSNILVIAFKVLYKESKDTIDRSSMTTMASVSVFLHEKLPAAVCRTKVVSRGQTAYFPFIFGRGK